MRNKKKIYRMLFSAIAALLVLVFAGENVSKTSNVQGLSDERTTATVVRVVDGDTIDALVVGQTKRIRLIGINTPETVDPRRPVECFGAEASHKAKEILNGRQVTVESDSTQGDADKYGRLLRYVFLEDGTNFNLLMIREGYAYEYTYNAPYKYHQEFNAAEQEARTKKAGLWGDVCQK